MNGALLVAGTCSDAGKSVVVAGICRALRRRGLSVAPFKAQNMSLNSTVTAGGEEIGRAQAAQAQACGLEPEVAMNPVLLKPSGERRSQVIVMGSPHADLDAKGYQRLKQSLRPRVLAALASLRERYDAVICEGAGSPAEINLREHDIANLGLARDADMPVVVVGDIDRGGVIASLYGTLALLERADQRLIAGFVVNKFRGDPDVLRPGLDRLRDLTGRPTFGVLPWREGLWLDAEDSLALDAQRDSAPPPLGADGIEVAVVRLRWMSNFTDFDALAGEPGVSVRFTRSVADIRRADLVVLPGTKATVEDLLLLRERGLDRALAERAAAGAPVLGICGGYQMLGRFVLDEVESGHGRVAGLGLLPVETRFEREKQLAWTVGRVPLLGSAPVRGYEIHHGRTARCGGTPLIETEAGEDGCVEGAVVGTSLHGAAEGDEFRRALLAWMARLRGLSFVPGRESFATARETRLDALGDLLEEHADVDALGALIEQGAPPDLPVLAAAPVAAPAMTLKGAA
ncbi:MAG: cobyric acid synthase [Thermoleophilaceae bacterium]